MRLFVAINLDDAARAAIGDALKRFPATNPPWRWAQPATWHVTIKFLGETGEAALGPVAAALAGAACRHGAFDLALGEFGAFPNLRAPRVLFFGLASGEGECAAIAREVDDALRDAIGLEPESRPFHAHVTVARVKERLTAGVRAKLGTVPPISHPAFSVSTIDLMESRLAPSGATYSVVERFPLSGPDGVKHGG